MKNIETTLSKAIKEYVPYNEQETVDKTIILKMMEEYDNIFSRENLVCHMTASGWTVNPSRDKVLMAYHKIYDSWAWLGGHADGEEDLLAVAVREVKEESGIKCVKPVSDQILSLEVLTVDGHEKNGHYVPSHLHLNITYLIEASDEESVSVKTDENSAVAWFLPEEALERSSEPWFVERIYSKLIEKAKLL